MTSAPPPRVVQRVLVPTKAAPEMLAVLREYPGLQVEAPGDLAAAELAAALAAADGVIIRSNNTITRALIEAAPRLRIIGRAGAGVDNVDVEAATEHGVLVVNTPGENAIATAEHTLAMLLALARRIPAGDRSVKAGEWQRARFQGVELHGKTLGIVGLGRIGHEVARRAQAFDMRVVACDPFLAAPAAAAAGVALVPFEALLQQADFVTVHTPLGPETRHLLGREALSRMRPGVRIVNCARGGIVDEDALCDAIDAGHVAGAALDVYENEPPGAARVTAHAAIITTPHVAGSTVEAQRGVGIAIARAVGDFLTTGAVAHAVNPAALERRPGRS